MTPPRIGITTETEVGLVESRKQLKILNVVPVPYLEAVAEAGGLPLPLPVGIDAALARYYLGLIDGLLLSGGEDIDPAYFGEEPERHLGPIDAPRDRMEWELIRGALEGDVPILGICRGIQVLNVAAGGSLYQDIAQRPDCHVKHRQQAPGDYPTHGLRVAPDSRLAALWGDVEVRTNTFHHQAVKDPAPGFRATAWSADGVVEALESTRHAFVLGVQYHPELMWRSHLPSRRLFEALVAAAARRAAPPAPEGGRWREAADERPGRPDALPARPARRGAP